jgi:hypothetical protein
MSAGTWKHKPKHGASVFTLLERCKYGGRKARSAARRLRGRVFIYRHPSGGSLAIEVKR